jgi:hypothetical protein
MQAATNLMPSLSVCWRHESKEGFPALNRLRTQEDKENEFKENQWDSRKKSSPRRRRRTHGDLNTK